MVEGIGSRNAQEPLTFFTLCNSPIKTMGGRLEGKEQSLQRATLVQIG
jgi:hypothetical protein